MLLKGEDRFFTGELPYCEVRAFPCTRFHFTFAVHARQRRQVPVVGTVRLSSPESDRERTVNSVRVRLASTVREAARPIALTGLRGRSTFVPSLRRALAGDRSDRLSRAFDVRDVRPGGRSDRPSRAFDVRLRRALANSVRLASAVHEPAFARSSQEPSSDRYDHRLAYVASEARERSSVTNAGVRIRRSDHRVAFVQSLRPPSRTYVASEARERSSVTNATPLRRWSDRTRRPVRELPSRAGTVSPPQVRRVRSFTGRPSEYRRYRVRSFTGRPSGHRLPAASPESSRVRFARSPVLASSLRSCLDRRRRTERASEF